jgi:hypothetical protein
LARPRCDKKGIGIVAVAVCPYAQFGFRQDYKFRISVQLRFAGFPAASTRCQLVADPLIRQFRENSRAGQLALHARRTVNFQPLSPGQVPSGADTWQVSAGFRERYGPTR